MRGWFGFVGVLAACGGATGPGSEAPTSDEGTTWFGDVQPIVESRCLSCHQPGGPAPLDLRWEDPTSMPPWAEAAVQAVADRRMPPWPHDDSCRSSVGSRALPDDALAVFQAWADEGFVMGSPEVQPPPYPAAVEAPDPAELGEPTLVLGSDAPWTARTAELDEYRCFVLDLDTTDDVWVRGLRMVPGFEPVVHHAIVYQFLPSQTGEIERMEQRDAEDPLPGYDCWGNPNADTVFTWAPGQVGERLPDGVARFAPAGSRWILQIHYNTLGMKAEDIEPDSSTVEVWTMAAGEKPDLARISIPIPHGGIRIPAGDPKVVEKDTFDLGFLSDFLGGLIDGVDAHIVAVMGHMHQLGTAISLHAETDAGRECLLDIPVWDFGWQMSYSFPEEAWVPVADASALEIKCVYDNSAANQPVVDGVLLDPRDVTWGEGTRDEMCLAYVVIQAPSGLVELLPSFL